jgi:hypothetical protein
VPVPPSGKYHHTENDLVDDQGGRPCKGQPGSPYLCMAGFTICYGAQLEVCPT